MKDIAKEAYEVCQVGGSGSIAPQSADEQTLMEFQVVLLAAEDMQQRGLIHISNIHRESYTSKNFIDLIVFQRLR